MSLAVNLVIEFIAYLCECMTQLLCIHAFLGKKIRADVKTVIFAVMYIATLMIIINFDLPELCTFLTNAFVLIYILIKFKLRLSQSIILTILDLLAAVSMQVITLILFQRLFERINQQQILGLLVNIVAFALMSIFVHLIRLNKLYIKIVENEKTIIRIIILCGILFIYLLIMFKTKKQLVMFPYFISAIMAYIVIILILYWQRDRHRMEQKSLELHMHEIYGKTFEKMVENIRIRQHDFKNQIAAIYGMHLTAENFDELVESQKEYCDYLIKESRYDSILTKCNDKILAGFLYTKFTECEKKGMDIQFDIVVNDSRCKLPTYELIELSGILLDNAVEYEIENKKGKEIYFSIKDEENGLNIVCRNKADYIPMETIGNFFKKEYSSKGDDRGLGLYNVKKMLEDNGEIIVTNQMINEDNWIEFNININR